MLILRVLTALILIPLALLAIFKLPPLYFTLLCAVISTLAAMEWANLLQCKLSYRIIFLEVFVALLLGILAYPSYITLWVGAVFWVAPLYWCVSYTGESKGWLANPLAKSIVGYIALLTACFSLVSLRALENGAFWVVLFFALIWATDIFAYFVGRFFGKRRLAVKISPNKTIEGFLGGVIGAMIVAGVGYFFIRQHAEPLPALYWFAIAFITILLGVLGDLFESLMKRLANVKDSGHILPGHGGVLDRIDSVIAALPFYALSISALNHVAL